MSREVELLVVATVVGNISTDIETQVGGTFVSTMTRLVNITFSEIKGVVTFCIHLNLAINVTIKEGHSLLYQVRSKIRVIEQGTKHCDICCDG